MGGRTGAGDPATASARGRRAAEGLGGVGVRPHVAAASGLGAEPRPEAVALTAERAGERRGEVGERPRALEPGAPWQAPGEYAAPRPPASRVGRPLLGPSFPLRPRPRSHREEDESLELVPAADPPPPARERSPSARRARLRQLQAQAPSKARSGRGRGRGGLPAPPGGGYLPNRIEPRALGPRADSAGPAPTLHGGAS